MKRSQIGTFGFSSREVLLAETHQGSLFEQKEAMVFRGKEVILHILAAHIVQRLERAQGEVVATDILRQYVREKTGRNITRQTIMRGISDINAAFREQGIAETDRVVFLPRHGYCLS